MKTVIFFFVHPIVNIPPPINFAAYLASKKYKVILIGYKTDETKKIEGLPNGAKILRVNLKGRSITLKPLSRLYSLFEFIYIARYVLKRVRPFAVITFNDPASIILKYCSKIPKKIAWLLEYPEKKYSGRVIYHMLLYSSKFWNYADALVFPSKERHVLGAMTNQNILLKESFIVHNAPTVVKHNVKSLDSNVLIGLNFLKINKNAGKINVIYTGAVGNRYGLEDIVAAVGADENLRLLIVGKKHDLSIREVNNAIGNVKYKHNILFIDQVPYLQLQLLFEYSDIGHVYYYPDTLNTLFSAPGKMYEYLKGGQVILTDSNSCIKTDLENHNCGIFYMPGNVKTLTSKLTYYLKRADELEKMKSQSKQLFKDKYNLEKQVDKVTSFLNE